MSAGGTSEPLDVIPAFPRELVERNLGLGAVLESHHDALLEHAQGADLARHAAAAPTTLRAGRAHLGKARAQLLVRRELVEQATLESSAIAEQPAVGERHVLRLRHLHRDGLERPEVRSTAELPAAGTD